MTPPVEPAAQRPGAGVRERVASVKARIAAAALRAGRDPASVELVAVSKGVAPDQVAEAVAAGIRAVGENRAQELLAKASHLAGLEVEWHFVGRIQRNKVKALAPLVTVWHAVDRVAVGEEVARRAPGARVFVEVNVAGEAQKAGCAPGDAAGLVRALQNLGLRVEGLMTVPPLGANPRPYFRHLRRLAEEAGVGGLSMGMSDDFEVAVEEGATTVRVGREIFGPRPSSG